MEIVRSTNPIIDLCGRQRQAEKLYDNFWLLDL